MSAFARVFEGVRAGQLTILDSQPYVRSGRADVSGRGEVGAVIGQHDVRAIWHSLDEGLEEFGGGAPADALVQFDEGELGCPVDADQQIELALLRVDFGDVDVEVAYPSGEHRGAG